MQSNKAVELTSCKNFVSATGKFQSCPVSLYNVDNKDKSLPLLLSATSKACHYKGTGVQAITDNGLVSKSSSSEKKSIPWFYQKFIRYAFKLFY